MPLRVTSRLRYEAVSTRTALATGGLSNLMKQPASLMLAIDSTASILKSISNSELHFVRVRQ